MNSKIFSNKNFLLLWIGKVISQLGDKFYAIALAWWILQETNSPRAMGLFLLISVLPGLIFGFFAGAVVDRCNRKNVIIITDIIRGLLVILIVCLSMFKLLQVWHIFVIGASISFITAFFDPAVQAIIPQIVDKERLTEANSMSQIVNGICTVIGPMFGAIAISWFGLTYVFLFNGISYFASAILENMIILKSNYKISDKTNIWLDMKEGILFLKNKQQIIRVIIVIAIAHFFLGSLMVLLPFLAKKLNGNGIRNLGYMQTILGLGLLLGSVYVRRKKSNRINEYCIINLIMFVGICFVGIGIEQFFIIKTIIPYMILLIFIGGSVACAVVFWQLLIQLNTPNNMTGRIFSISTLVGNVSLPIAYGIFGALLNHISIMQLMIFSGCCLIILCCVLIFRIRLNKINDIF